MIENFIKYLTNPITARLIIELEERGNTTAKQLATQCPDIPHATLYRSLNRMCNDGVLQIVCENKVRGTYEKVYALCKDFSTNINDNLFDQDGNRVKNFSEDYLKCFIQFAKGLIKEFQAFNATPDNQNLDCGGFIILTTEASDRQIETLFNEVSDRIEKMKDEPCEESKKLRSIAVVVPPANTK